VFLQNTNYKTTISQAFYPNTAKTALAIENVASLLTGLKGCLWEMLA
ncbi:MAG: hypothetical protein RLZZ597_1990, partial [Cyanobacteriota bacterium]